MDVRQFVADNTGIAADSPNLVVDGAAKIACAPGQPTKEMRFTVTDDAYTDAVVAFIARNETSPCVAAIMAAPPSSLGAAPGDGDGGRRLAAGLGVALLLLCCLLLALLLWWRRRKGKESNLKDAEEGLLGGGKPAAATPLPGWAMNLPLVRRFLDPTKYTRRFDIQMDEELTKVSRDDAMGDDMLPLSAPADVAEGPTSRAAVVDMDALALSPEQLQRELADLLDDDVPSADVCDDQHVPSVDEADVGSIDSIVGPPASDGGAIELDDFDEAPSGSSQPADDGLFNDARSADFEFDEDVPPPPCPLAGSSGTATPPTTVAHDDVLAHFLRPAPTVDAAADL